MILSVYTDGGSRGNPGPSGFGVVVQDESKKTIHTISQYIGIKTNNEAEYAALLDVLNWLSSEKEKLNITSVNFYSDSQLLVRQMQGVYKVKADNIKPLYRTATTLLSSLSLPYTFIDIRREFNSEADKLANEAMDRKS